MFSAPVPRQAYSGNGVTTVFAVPFEFRESTDLLVLLKDTTTEEVTELILDTDYTVSGGDSESGFVTMDVAPSADEELTIIDNPAAIQEAEIEEGAEFPSEDVEISLDRTAMVARRAKDLASRSLHASDADPADVDLELPPAEERASAFLAFDADGDPIASDGGIDAAIPVSAFIETLLDDANATAARTTLDAQQATNSLTSLGAAPAQDDTVPIYDTSGSIHRKVTLSQLISSIGTAAKTTTYVLTGDDHFVTADTDGGAFTITLPDCASNPGKIFRIKKVGTAFATANVLTIARAGSDTIFDTAASGTSTTLHTPGEEIEIISMGATVWQVFHRRIPSAFAAYTPTFTGFGTASAIECAWRRLGDSALLLIKFTCGTSTATEARITLPAGLTSAATPAITSIRAVGTIATSGTDSPQYFVLIEPSVAYMTFGYQLGASSAGLTKVLGNALFSGTQKYSYSCIVPITGWNG